MKLNENAITVLKKRYLAKNENGEPTETPEGLFHRVAKAVADADSKFDKSADTEKTEQIFYDMMTNLEFLPNSPTLMNAGRPLGQLSACFVLPIEDSMEAIFEAVKNAAIIHKSGGGTGFSFSRIRASGSTVNSTGGVASGPISFMKVFNSATEAVKQGGTRRGANMGILRIDHPDIMEFITCKADNKEINNFNISVGITEKFMESVKANKAYDLVDPHTKKVVGQLNAKEVYDKIVDSAWRNGEPGIIFLDRLNRDNVVPSIAEIEATNPCGEQPLLPYESCNLGSINLCEMLKCNDSGYEIDYKKLETTVKNAVHFLDNVIEINKYPLKEIDETTKATRKIGLGIMGFCDMLYRMEIPYNSNKAVALAEEVMGFIQETGKKASCELGKTRGTFPLYTQSIFADSGKEYRNATVTTIAPTGTLSILAGVSSGIEPNFALGFIRNVMDNTELLEINSAFTEIAKENGFYSENLMREIAECGHIPDDADIPDKWKKIFVTAHEVSPIWHIRMQAAFQKYTDNAVSKTVNFKTEATQQEVSDVFMLAYELDCKGVTIYRDKSRESQVLNIGQVDGKDNKATEAVPLIIEEAFIPHKVTPRPRPDVTTGFTEKVKIGCGNLYITVNYDEEGICEVFTNTGRAGGCPSQSEATSRLVSVALRSGMSVDAIVEQLKGIRCPSTIRQPDVKCTSCPDAIARVIRKVAKMQQGDHSPAPQDLADDMKINTPGSKLCPECGKIVEHEGGCMICRNCGYSKCG